MSYDGFVTRCVTEELNRTVLNGKIDKIYQPEKDEIILQIRTREGNFRLLLLSDHPTLMTTRTHDGAPVPYAIFDSRRQGTPRKFSEAAAAHGTFLENGDLLMPRLFEQG